MVDLVFDALIDAVEDTLYLIPFLFATYLFLEWLEHKTGKRRRDAISHAGKVGPVVGALLGVIPQCGFSAVASTLYAGRVIGLGTLFAVYLSTSDEMMPIFIAEQQPLETIAFILICKLCCGMFFGFLVDVVLRLSKRRPQGSLRIHELCERDHCHCNHDCDVCKNNPLKVYEHYDDCADGCDHSHHEHDHSHEIAWIGIVKSALIHTAQVTLFVLLVSCVLNIALELVGLENLTTTLAANEFLEIIAAAFVGLIPNCVASVAIAQLYVDGVLSFGACMAGLLSAAGVGLLVLFRTNRGISENITITAVLLVASVIFGLIFQAFPALSV